MDTTKPASSAAALPLYSIHAIRYGHLERRSSENFLGGDSHDVAMPLDYYVWVIKGEDGRAILVDTGFSKATGEKRGRQILRPVAEGLRALDVDPGTVEHVIITHMHYDYAGNLPLFPKATFHIQEREMSFCTGRCMCQDIFRHHFEAEDVVEMVRRLFIGRVAFCDGTQEIAPGLSVHLVGGHTDGHQVVRVHTARGWVVLAADALHFYANLERRIPFPAFYNLADMLAAFDELQRLAETPEHIVPGHDPEVMARYPASSPGMEGWIARLDADPVCGDVKALPAGYSGIG